MIGQACDLYVFEEMMVRFELAVDEETFILKKFFLFLLNLFDFFHFSTAGVLIYTTLDGSETEAQNDR